MKRNLMIAGFLGAFSLMSAQFTVNLDTSPALNASNAFLYSYNGSQEVIAANGVKTASGWSFKVDKPYSGLMKVYFPATNDAVMVVSENKDVNVKATVTDQKLGNVDFIDDVNKQFAGYQDGAKKKDQILPVLIQMQTFYSPQSDFGMAMKKEIAKLSAYKAGDISNYPFLSYYTGNLQKYVDGNGLKQEDYIKFLNNSPQYLESSAQIRQVLMNYMSLSSKPAISGDIDKLLKAVDPESIRGQLILSELIDIFEMYGMDDLKAKYLKEAKEMTCTITDRLTSTINNSEKVAIGAVMPNYTFTKPFNTTAKTLHDIKAKKKLIMVWSSTCSHCEAQIPQIIEAYKGLKASGVEIIGLSVDADAASYNNRASALPWINDSELKGWNSSVSTLYNVHATPSYFLLDANNKIIAKPANFSQALSLIKGK